MTICDSCATTLTDDPGPVCARCRATDTAVEKLKAAEVALEQARADLSHYAQERTRLAREAVAAGVRPAAIARGLGITRQRMNSLINRDGKG